MGIFARLLSKVRGEADDLNLDFNEEEDQEKPQPEFAMPLVRFSGGPGGGKSFDMIRIGTYAAFHYRYPVIVQDTKGDLTVYINQMIDTLSKKKTKLAEKKIAFLKDNKRFKVIREMNGLTMFAIVKEIQDRSSKMKERRPSCYLIVDEAGTLRDNTRRDEKNTSIEFWNIAATFRNAGILCYATSHRELGDGGVPPLARETTRAVVLYSAYDEVNYFGVDIDQALTTKPLSKEKVFIDCIDRKLKTFSLDNGPIAEGQIPEVLIHPVNVTRIKKMEF